MEELKALVDTLSVNMRDNTEAVTKLRVDQAKDRKDHDELVRATGRTRRAWIVAAVILVAAVVAFYLQDRSANHKQRKTNAQVQKVSDQQAADLTCIAAHEDAQDTRSAILTAKSNSRNEALRAMVDAQFKALTYVRSAHPAQAIATHLIDVWNGKTEAFRKADSAYAAALKVNPVQKLQFTCSDRLRSAAPSPTVTATATVTGTATATWTAPGPTVTAPASTETVAVPIPGATSTVVIRQPGTTMTATITTTHAPPDCLTHPVPPCTLNVPTVPRLP